MLNSMEKIIFTGPMGAGKTTAISAISDEPPVKTDVQCSGEEKQIKHTTTVAMDYSYIQLDDGKRVHLYGTPGQKRFEFMWNILTKGGLGLVLLVNNDHPKPIEQMEFYLNKFSSFIRETGAVIGVTRLGINDQAQIEDYQQKLFERGEIYPLFEVDGRNEIDVKILVQSLLAILEA